MTNERKSFVLYFNYYNQIKLLSPEDQGRVFCAIFEYAMNGILPCDLSKTAEIVFSFIRDMIDIDNEKYEDICRKRSENGKKGGRPPKNVEKTKSFLNEAKKAYNDTDKDTENDTDTEKVTDTGTDKDKDIDSGKTNCSASSQGLSERSADSVTASRLLSEEDMDFLKNKGVETAYVEERLERAAEYAARKGESLRSVLLSWWIGDRDKRGRPRPVQVSEKEPPSFDMDSFFEAACARALREL